MAGNAKAGRKAKPDAVKDLAGTFRPDRVKPDAVTVEPFEKAPSRPVHLKGVARAMWQRTASKLTLMKVLTQVDLRGLEVYCSLYARWRNAEDHRAKHGYHTWGGKKGETLVASPYVKISLDCSVQMKSWMGEFGVTPSSRSRVKVDKKVPETPGGRDWFGERKNPGDDDDWFDDHRN